MRIVLDTNILVASLWKPGSKSAGIVRDVIKQRITACYTTEIAEEYSIVLRRLKFRFPISVTDGLVHGITDNGLSVEAPKSDIYFAHESDRVFYDVAVFCGAKLITSNLKHFPESDPRIMTPGAFAAFMMKNGSIANNGELQHNDKTGTHNHR